MAGAIAIFIAFLMVSRQFYLPGPGYSLSGTTIISGMGSPLGIKIMEMEFTQ